ncbi:MAG: response regulator [Anaerolineae bacterium]
MTLIRVLLVDDHRIVRQGISSLLELENDLTVVGEAASGARALELIEEKHPDIVLLDIKMPDMDGADVCREIQARYPDLPVIILTAYSGDDQVLRCIQAGARGYVLKDVDVVELVRTIRVVHSGQSVLDSKAIAAVMDGLRRPAAARYHGLEFSQREIEIIRLVSQGLSNKEIADRLFLSTSAVKYHLRNIMDKLGVSSRAAVIYEATQHGVI